MPVNNEVGTKIKNLRELRAISLAELAERCNMSVVQIEKIEAGEVAASLTPLLKLARGLGVRLGTFLDDSESFGPVVTRSRDSGKSLRFAGSADKKGLDFFPLAANKNDRNMEPFIIDVHPPLHQNYELSSHEGEEFIFVLQGAVEVAWGKQTYQLGSGDCIYYDSITPHHVHALEDAPAKILAVVFAP
ncbi:MAG: XRE family transcriptional regulator [Lentisphaeria bacterium]|jgi:transcriptional regulator with XRE-family HTH domain|nr:XRE family transcriptional regulator [Lentisphaeria bacterium]MDY0177029.1 XRE family transcriptional regulator [Lentisphaeria bacterium]NLZ60409.1 helix-turn-helix domain-containing protein [Lentisphaerota bacterium]